MSINPLSGLAAIFLQPVTSLFSSSTTASTDSSSLALPQDATPQISRGAQFLNILQQLSSSNPAAFKQITARLSDKLTQAATKAESQGQSDQATQLKSLASEFGTASQTGQISPAGQPVTAHHGHHAGRGAYGRSQPDSTDLLSLLGTGTGKGIS